MIDGKLKDIFKKKESLEWYGPFTQMYSSTKKCKRCRTIIIPGTRYMQVSKREYGIGFVQPYCLTCYLITTNAK